MNKIKTMEAAAKHIKDGMVLMIGGFLANGTAEGMIDQILANGSKDLTIITNDTSYIEKGVGRLVANKRVKKVIASHIGTNPETGKQMNAGELEVTLVPQGTLAEQIRAAGAGLGGILTPTGIGTAVEEGKEKITVNGVDYLLELPLRADIALIKGSKVDKAGNIYYNQSTRNFNPLMATAADLVIVEAEQIMEVGEINPNDVMTPGLFVDIIVDGRE